MQAEKEQLEKLLDKYLQGCASPDEVRRIHQWIGYLDLGKQELFRSATEEEDARLKMRKNIYAQIKPEGPVKSLNPFPSWLGAVAASLLLLISLYLGFYYLNMPSDQFATITTDGSGIKKVTLADGTLVTLNRFSKLEIRNDFNEEERKVRLSGEAFFEVQKDSLRPFIVETGEINTYVLGTAFNVEYYEGEEQTRVSLLRGKVRVQQTKKGAKHAELMPGQMIVYNRLNHSALTEDIAVQNVAGWIENRLVFNDVPLADAIYRLKQRYTLEVQYEKGVSLKGKYITGEYPEGAVGEVLEAILLVHNLHLKKKGEAFYVTPQL